MIIPFGDEQLVGITLLAVVGAVGNVGDAKITFVAVAFTQPVATLFTIVG